MRRLRSAVRARLTPGRFALAAALIAAFLVVVALAEDRGDRAPRDEAIALVPADALLYAHLAIDRDSKGWKHAGQTLSRFPRLVAARDRLLRSVAGRGGTLDLETEVFPWMKDEAAIALLAGRGQTARSLILLEVSDPPLARTFLSRSAERPRDVSYREVAIRLYGDLATSFIGRFLAIGSLDNVKAAIDVRARRLEGLSRSRAYALTRRALPHENRLLNVFTSPGGLRGVVASQGGLVGRFAALLDEPRLEGVGAVLGVDAEKVRIEVASAVDGRAQGRGTELFSPRLLQAASDEAIAYLGMRGVRAVLGGVSRLLGGTALRLPAELDRLRSELAGARLASVLDDEAALVVAPGETAATTTLIASGVGPRESDELLTRLQPLLARLVSGPVGGRVPTFESRQIAGASAVTLRISPGLAITYSIAGGRAIVSTSPDGIRAARSSGPRLTDNPLFAGDLLENRKSVTSVVFFDLEQLLALGQQAGLGGTTEYRSLRTDLGPVKAVTAVTSRQARTKTAAISIEVR